MNGTVDLNLLPEEDPSIDPHMDFMIAYMDLGGLVEVPDSSTAKPTVSESGQENIQIWNKLASSNEDFEYILIREQDRLDTQARISTVASDLKLRIDRLIEKLPILYEKVFEGDRSTRGEFLTKIDTAKRLSEYLEKISDDDAPNPISEKKKVSLKDIRMKFVKDKSLIDVIPPELHKEFREIVSAKKMLHHDTLMPYSNFNTKLQIAGLFKLLSERGWFIAGFNGKAPQGVVVFRNTFNDTISEVQYRLGVSPEKSSDPAPIFRAIPK